MPNNNSSSKSDSAIPSATMERLPRYLMQLYRLKKSGNSSINSQTLGDSLGLKDTQIRKDLSYFGVFGKARYGYNIDFLLKSIEKILGLIKKYSMAIIGAGNIGKALAAYNGYGDSGFEVNLIFDRDPAVIGTTIGGVLVHDIKKLSDIIAKHPIDIGIITVPEKGSKEVASELIKCGVKAIYNFSPAELHSFEGVYIENANISFGLFKLAHHLEGSWPRKK